MFWFGLAFVLLSVIPLFWSLERVKNNPSLVVAAETRETDEEQKVTRSLMTEMNAF